MGTSLVASHNIQKKFSTKLKIVNDLQKIKFGFGIAKDDAILLSIFNKVVDSFTQVDKQEIFNRWVVATVEKEHDYTLLWRVVGAFSFVLVIILFFYNEQRKLKNSLAKMVELKTDTLKKQNMQLKESLKDYEELLNAAIEVIIISDENHNIVDINSSGIKLFEVKDKKDIIGKNMFSFLPKSGVSKVASAFKKDTQEVYELTIKTLNKKNIPVLAAGKDMYRGDKKFRISTLLDITELKQKNDQLLQQSKLAQMGDMVSMIAHQWRQPLNAISASGINLSLLSSMEMLDDEKVQENSKFIQEQTQKMSQTIDTFMNFVKPSKESKSFKLSHSLESITQIMGTQLANHNIRVNIEVKKENLSIVGHEDLLEQVIINLLSNSRDAFEELSIDEKFLSITADEEDGVKFITIKDNAGGIPQETQDKIFNPYFTTKEQGKGTGIGLYMSKDIMKKSFKGDLEYSATENGSCFKIIFGV